MRHRLITAYFIILVGVTSIPFYILNLILRILTGFFDRKLQIIHMVTCFWGSLYTYLMPMWKIRTSGRENIRRNACYMVVCNHQSQLDILVAFRLYFHYKFVSKAEIFRVPLIGWNMVLNRYIRLNRGDKSSVEKMMQDCERTLDEGSSVFFFPEGTRSKDGKIKDFKTGAFILAKKKKVPILPIVVRGTGEALPKYVMKTEGVHQIRMRVLPEIPYEQFENLTLEETISRVRDVMIQGLANLEEDFTKERP
ncbi:MAG: 1-acyl-sn-glycerol-3-phosphate acyltransferase [Spirochaetae bacterium HGW-Spirochaetae-1]|jgi:1-acyl-sn-glycerol-3-phosphate acyltransferase|nr:MAG: 1-acyl-sn-glycerol-3-phosphate acyltransferase [Spirochaetae bacterium HGW-Spirochaetae-1]